MPTAERAFADPHPAAEGHFPGNPVIPGAVVLAETLGAIEAGLGVALAGARVRSAKFLSPARPGDRMRVDYARADGGGDRAREARWAVRFSCAVGGRPVLRGEVECRTTPTRP